MTGDRKWEFKMNDVTDAGILTTGSDLLFSGGREGYFFALDARNGELLWKASVGGAVASGPMSYSVARQAIRRDFRGKFAVCLRAAGIGVSPVRVTIGMRHQFLSFPLIQTSGGNVRS